MTRRARHHQRPSRREQGVALVMVLTVIAVLTVFVAELTQSTTTSFQIAMGERDRLRAEYLAKSGLNLTRLLITNERTIRAVVAPVYSMVLHHPPPQLNVWGFANEILSPFAGTGAAGGAATGIDFTQMQGVVDTGGTFEIIAVPENSKINLNKPLFLHGDDARRSLAMQLFALLGGLQPEGPYDAMFNTLDADGQMTTRLDIVSGMIDWWDEDQLRTVYDPGARQVASGGGEDDIYSQLKDPYEVKNSPFDSLEEVRLIRGVSDDFWATFIDPDPTDPRRRLATVYGSGAVNPNEADPVAILARLCSFLPTEPLCMDLLVQAPAFVSTLSAIRMFARGIPIFGGPGDFLAFVQGKSEVYSMLLAFPLAAQLLLWQPVQIPPDRQAAMQGAFITDAAIFTIESTGRVGSSTVRLRSVVNFQKTWTPPEQTTGKGGGLGVFHHYRVE